MRELSWWLFETEYGLFFTDVIRGQDKSISFVLDGWLIEEQQPTSLF